MRVAVFYVLCFITGLWLGEPTAPVAPPGAVALASPVAETPPGRAVPRSIQFVPCFVTKLASTPPCSVDVLYSPNLRIPSEQDAAGVWRWRRPVDRSAMASAVVAALVASENPVGETAAARVRRRELERFRPLVLDLEPWRHLSPDFGPAEIREFNHWIVVTARYITGRSIGLVGDWDSACGAGLFPMAYGPGSLAENFLVDLDKAYGGRTITPFVCPVYAAGPEVGKPLTAGDVEKLARMIAKYAATCNGTFTVLVWSEEKTVEGQAAVVVWGDTLADRVWELIPSFVVDEVPDPDAGAAAMEREVPR